MTDHFPFSRASPAHAPSPARRPFAWRCSIRWLFNMTKPHRRPSSTIQTPAASCMRFGLRTPVPWRPSCGWSQKADCRAPAIGISCGLFHKHGSRWHRCLRLSRCMKNGKPGNSESCPVHRLNLRKERENHIQGQAFLLDDSMITTPSTKVNRQNALFTNCLHT